MPVNRTRYLLHVTHKNNAYAIGVHGLTSEFSRARLPGVFLVTRERLDWCKTHVAHRWGCGVDELVVYRVAVRRSRLVPVRWSGVRRGVWRHVGAIHVSKIELVETPWQGETE